MFPFFYRTIQHNALRWSGGQRKKLKPVRPITIIRLQEFKYTALLRTCMYLRYLKNIGFAPRMHLKHSQIWSFYTNRMTECSEHGRETKSMKRIVILTRYQHQYQYQHVFQYKDKWTGWFSYSTFLLFFAILELYRLWQVTLSQSHTGDSGCPPQSVCFFIE